jgi:colanic acid biosynthesis protein WcaH
MVFVEGNLFDEIRNVMPIVCVDLVIPKNGDILLVKRSEPPAQGQWWTPGGRILHGETIQEASIRKANAEIHLDCRFKKILGVTECIFNNVTINAQSISIHTVNVVCLMELKDETQQIQLDHGHTDYLWARASFAGLHIAVEQIFDLYTHKV